MLNAPQFLSRAGARSSLYRRGDALSIVICLASALLRLSATQSCLCVRALATANRPRAYRAAISSSTPFA